MPTSVMLRQRAQHSFGRLWAAVVRGKKMFLTYLPTQNIPTYSNYPTPSLSLLFSVPLVAPVWTCAWMSKHPWTARAARSPQRSSAFPHHQWWLRRAMLICPWAQPTRTLWRCLRCEDYSAVASHRWTDADSSRQTEGQKRSGMGWMVEKTFRVLVWPWWSCPLLVMFCMDNALPLQKEDGI